MMNRSGFRSWGDPLLHMAFLIAAIAVATLAPWRGPASHPGAGTHPSRCRACSACTREAIAARDHFLWKSGWMDLPDAGD